MPGKKLVLQEPLFWILIAGFMLGALVVFIVSLRLGHGEVFPDDIVFKSLAPIYLPVLTEMVAFFFAIDDNARAAASTRQSDGAQARVGTFLMMAFSLTPVLLLLGDKAGAPGRLATFQLIAQPIIAYLIVYYYGGRLRAVTQPQSPEAGAQPAAEGKKEAEENRSDQPGHPVVDTELIRGATVDTGQ